MKTKRNLYNASPILAAIAGLALLAPVSAHASGYIWKETFGGSAHAADVPQAAVVDGNDNILSVGQVVNAPQVYGFGTVKYDSAGHQLWTQFEPDGDRRVIVSLVAVDSSNNAVTVVGQGEENAFANMARYSSDGKLLSRAVLNTPNDISYVNHLLVSANGDFTVTCVGLFQNAAAGTDYSQWNVYRYDPTGNLLWSDTFKGHDDPGFPDGGSYSGDNTPYAATMDAQDDLVVAGDETTDGVANLVVRKYAPDGTVLFSSEYDAPQGNNAVGSAVTLDKEGNIYVGGSTSLPAERHEFFGQLLAAKLSPDGHFQWERFYGNQFEANAASQIALDKSGNVIVAGSGMDTDNGFEIALLKLKPSGATIFAKHTGQDFAELVFGLYTSTRTDDFYLVHNEAIYNPSTQQFVDHYAFVKFYPGGGIGHEQDFYLTPNNPTLQTTTFDPNLDTVYALFTVNSASGINGDTDWETYKYRLGA